MDDVIVDKFLLRRMLRLHAFFQLYKQRDDYKKWFASDVGESEAADDKSTSKTDETPAEEKEKTT